MKEPFEQAMFKRLFFNASGVSAQGAVSAPVRIAHFFGHGSLDFFVAAFLPGLYGLRRALFFPVLCRLLRKDCFLLLEVQVGEGDHFPHVIMNALICGWGCLV